MAPSAQSQPEEEREPEPQTQLSIVDGQASPLSLTALHTALTARGVQMPYSSLAQFIGLGDIAEQLGVGGKGNRREFPRWSVDFLSSFLAWYTTAGIKKELAPDAVRHHLKQFRTSENSKTEILSSDNLETSGDIAFYEPGQRTDISGPVARFLSGLLSPLTRLPPALDNMAEAIRELREGRSSPPAPTAPVEDRLLIEDRLLTAEQAAELLACHPRSVSRYVTPVRPRTWRYSDCQRYIERLGEALRQAESEAAK